MHENMSPAVRRHLRTLGEDLRTARRKRRITQADLAIRMGVAVSTVQRLEAGDPGVSIEHSRWPCSLTARSNGCRMCYRKRATKSAFGSTGESAAKGTEAEEGAERTRQKAAARAHAGRGGVLNRVRVAIGEMLAPVGVIEFEIRSNKQMSLFRYADEWLAT